MAEAEAEEEEEAEEEAGDDMREKRLSNERVYVRVSVCACE